MKTELFAIHWDASKEAGYVLQLLFFLSRRGSSLLLLALREGDESLSSLVLPCLLRDQESPGLPNGNHIRAVVAPICLPAAVPCWRQRYWSSLCWLPIEA